jgi:hypothetical protein
MKSRGYAGFAGAMLAVASCLLWAGPEARAGAAHGHDGIYAVHVLTQHGSCQPSRMTTIAVTGGHVHATGHGLMRASGRVAPDGRVSVTLRLLHHIAHVVGRLKGHSGSGNWLSKSLACRGHWHATRQS